MLRRCNEAAKRYGYKRAYTDWRQIIEDPKVEIFDNCGPNAVHSEPSIEAAKAGKNVFCEKPLARTAEEAMSMVDVVEKAKVKNMVAFNYRFVPAIRLQKILSIVENLGEFTIFGQSIFRNG